LTSNSVTDRAGVLATIASPLVSSLRGVATP